MLEVTPDRISIITICFNNPEELIRTCESVDSQLLPPYEHLIVDGSTKPDICTWLQSELQPAFRHWICERDNGIADAFNKGVRHVKGDILLLLNSGDTLYDVCVLQQVTALFGSNPAAGWLHGKINTLRGGLWVIVGKPFENKKLYRGMRGVFHPTMYVRQALFQRHGVFDTSLKYAMDYDFLCRIAGEPFIFADMPLATFDPGGISSTSYIKAMKEARVVYRKHYGYVLKQTLWGWRLALLHYLLQSRAGLLLYKIKVKLGLADV